MADFSKLNGYNVKDAEARQSIATHTEELKFHSVAASPATYIVELPNGKNMFIDTGRSSDWDSIKTAIQGLGITKFDYAILTHFHSDHIGNVQNFIDEYDVSECQWFVGMKPDYTNHSSDISDAETVYDNIITLLANNDITPTVPTNDSYLTISDTTKLHFLNTDGTIAENYYGRIKEYSEDPINLNDFSLITEIIHKKVTILSTGDIERPVEEQYAQYLGKVDLMVAPHHGVNQDADRAFYFATMPDYALCSYVTTSPNWIQSYHKSFGYLKEVGSKIITAYSNTPIDGLFTFISNGENIRTTALDSGLTETIFNQGKIYTHFRELIKLTSQKESTVTLNQLFQNMPRGTHLTYEWWSDYSAAFPQVWDDITTLFPLFSAGMTLEFISAYDSYVLKAYDEKLEFMAVAKDNTFAWKVSGRGELGSIDSSSVLTIYLQEKLPRGQYTCFYYMESNSTVLATDGAYALNISVNEVTSTKKTGVITASLRSVYTGTTNTVTSAQSYFRTDQSPAFFWRVTSK